MTWPELSITLLIPTHLSPASFQVGQKHQAAFIPGRLFLHSPFQNVCKVGFFWGPWMSLYLVPPTLVFTETWSLSSLEVTK